MMPLGKKFCSRWPQPLVDVEGIIVTVNVQGHIIDEGQQVLRPLVRVGGTVVQFRRSVSHGSCLEENIIIIFIVIFNIISHMIIIITLEPIHHKGTFTLSWLTWPQYGTVCGHLHGATFLL